jgi:hypothetical protein
VCCCCQGALPALGSSLRACIDASKSMCVVMQGCLGAGPVQCWGLEVQNITQCVAAGCDVADGGVLRLV